MIKFHKLIPLVTLTFLSCVANETHLPVILLSASLFEEGKPKAILINP